MKKFLLAALCIAVTGFATTSCKDDEDENPALYTNIDKYIMDSDGKRYEISAATINATDATATTPGMVTLTFTSSEGGVNRKVTLVQTYALGDNINGGYSTTSTLRNLSATGSNFTRGTAIFSNLKQGSSSITKEENKNYIVQFSMKTATDEIISGTYKGVIQ